MLSGVLSGCYASAHQCYVNGELHPDADGGDEDHHGNSTEFDANQTHHSKQLHCHQRQYEDLERENGTDYTKQTYRIIQQNV